MTDAETQAAIDALAHRIRNRDAAVRDAAEDLEDAEPFALEFVTALRGHGWRPTEAKTFAGPKAAPSGTIAPLKPETTDLLRDLRADMEARAARDRAAKEAGAA